MVKIQHRQTEEIRDISRHTWETASEYQNLRKLWKVLDEGDPVTVIWIEDTGEHRELGLYDRDHAIRMIKMNSTKCYIKVEDSKPQSVSESRLIDKVLQDAVNCGAVSVRATPPDYHQALMKARDYGLISKGNSGYCLTKDGRIALDIGFDGWLEQEKQQGQPGKSNTIIFHGPVSESSVNQDSLSSNVSNHNLTNKQNAIAASTHKKVDQNTSSLNNWQRIYNWTNHNAISALLVAAIVGLVSLVMKWLGWL